jgi:hypothetical protein
MSMAETITLAVHGGRRRGYAVTLLVHALGATLAGSALGLLLGAAGAVVGLSWSGTEPIVVLLVTTTYAARELLGIPVPLPQRRAQVPDWWRTFFGTRVAAFLYGVGLGAGFLTYLSHGTFVAVALCALVSGDPLLGALLCAPFGAARAAAIVATGGAGSDGVEAVATSAWPRATNGVALLGIVLAASLTL